MLRHLSLIPNEILFTSRVLEKHLYRDDYLETYRYLDTYIYLDTLLYLDSLT